MSGQLVAVATLQLTDGQSLNFAVPSERVAQLQAGTLTSFSDLVVSSRRNKRAAAEHFYAQGLGFLSHDDWAKALPLFERAVDTDPDYAEAWYQTSYCNGMLGRHTEALRASRQVIRLRPDWPEPYVNMGHAYSRLAQYQGETYLKLNRVEEGIEAFKQATRLKPDFGTAYYNLALGYLALGDREAALVQYNILKAIDADLAERLFSLINP